MSTVFEHLINLMSPAQINRACAMPYGKPIRNRAAYESDILHKYAGILTSDQIETCLNMLAAEKRVIDRVWPVISSYRKGGNNG